MRYPIGHVCNLPVRKKAANAGQTAPAPGFAPQAHYVFVANYFLIETFCLYLLPQTNPKTHVYPPPFKSKYLIFVFAASLLWSCNPEKEHVAPSASAGVQNVVNPNPIPLPADEPPIGPPADLYAFNGIFTPNNSPIPSSTVTPGGSVYFHILTGGTIPPYGLATVAPGEADLVAILISGTTSAGVPFSITADRATTMNMDDLTYAVPFPYSNMPNYGTYVQSYRVVSWKVPPFMPAGNYTVQVWPYQTNGSTPRYFTAARRNYAQGPLVVSGATGAPGNLQRDPTITPTTASPVFRLLWPTSTFFGSQTLRTTIQNVSTGRYYCLASGEDPGFNGGLGYPALWEANAFVANTGGASVRYNSTALFGGQRLSPIPAGTYKVFLDEIMRNGTSTYLTTPANQNIVLP